MAHPINPARLPKRKLVNKYLRLTKELGRVLDEMYVQGRRPRGTKRPKTQPQVTRNKGMRKRNLVRFKKLDEEYVFEVSDGAIARLKLAQAKAKTKVEYLEEYDEHIYRAIWAEGRSLKTWDPKRILFTYRLT